MIDKNREKYLNHFLRWQQFVNGLVEAIRDEEYDLSKDLNLDDPLDSAYYDGYQHGHTMFGIGHNIPVNSNVCEVLGKFPVFYEKEKADE